MNNCTNRFLVAYDIVDNKRRRELAKLLQGHGYRLQYSLFQMDAKPSKMERFVRHVKSIIKPAEDSVIVVDLGNVLNAQKRKLTQIGDTKDVLHNGPLVF